MTETQLLDAVIELAQTAGYRVCHFRPARTSSGWRTALQGDAGWPDLVICGKGRFVVVELKSATGRTTDAQHDWLYALTEANVEAWVWTPKDWISGRIAKALGCDNGIIDRRTP